MSQFSDAPKLSPGARLDILERGRGMTTLALLSKAAIMNIAFLMTANTRGRRVQLVGIDRLLVAIQTLGLFMGAVNLVLGLPVMVEIPGFPVARVVAGVALPAQPQLVLVFLLVAGVAVRLGILEFRSFVALLALGLDVLAQ